MFRCAMQCQTCSYVRGLPSVARGVRDARVMARVRGVMGFPLEDSAARREGQVDRRGWVRRLRFARRAGWHSIVR